jgi:hypothetical protein
MAETLSGLKSVPTTLKLLTRELITDV